MKHYFIIFFMCIPSICFGYGNNQPLSVLNIKPAGTGTPALSATARIFRAYPGIEYNIRAAVVGGQYPYTYQLSNAPTGMAVNNKGVISWPNPQISASNISLRVTDQDGDYVDATWGITVTTSGFLFVDDDAGATQDGTIDHPYGSIQDILNLSGHESDIVYYRAGTYTVPVFHPHTGGSTVGCNLGYDGGRARQWINYPSESVTIDMDDHVLEGGVEIATPLYFDGLHFTNANNHAFRVRSGFDYVTFLRCELSNLTNDNPSYNANQGFYFSTENDVGHYLIFQDCEIHDYTDAAGIGSLYKQHDFLIEDTAFYNQFQTINSICVAVAAKTGIQNFTLRHNEFNINKGNAIGHPINSCFSGIGGEPSTYSRNIEICYNLFNGSGTGFVHAFNTHGAMMDTWYYRNTLIGDMYFKYLDLARSGGYPEDNGPFYIENNVIINALAGWSYDDDCGPDPVSNIGVDVDNLKGISSDNIIDVNGDLTTAYISYLGIVGWQIEDVTPATSKAIIKGTIR